MKHVHDLITPAFASDLLETIRACLQSAGDILKEDLYRAEGPRGRGGKAPADTEAEAVMRAHIRARFPAHHIIGEELGSEGPSASEAQPFVWLLDPNDGTRSYIQGYRGSAVSIGLLCQGEPIAGGVFAYAYPNSTGDLIMGGLPELFGGVTRNGALCPPSSACQPHEAVIAISQGADRSSDANIAQISPARYLAIPSIAYRLALAAVDDVQVGVSVNGPVAYDLAGGHALLKAQGRDLFIAPHQPYTYQLNGHGSYATQYAGGDPTLCAQLLGKDLSEPRHRPDQGHEPYPLCGPLKVKAPLAQDDQLDRAQGALLGMMAGDALGSLVEFQSARRIAERYPEGVRQMSDGGTFNKLAGQVTDDSEMAISLARSILSAGGYDQASAAVSYARWLESRPFDVGITTRTSLGPALQTLQSGQGERATLDRATSSASQESQANGALMRVTPLALYAAGQGLSDDQAAELARLDALITHPHVACQDANAVFVVALKRAITTRSTPRELYEYTLRWAERAALDESVLARVKLASTEAPTEGKGWVLIGLQAAFYALLHTPNPEEAVSWAISIGHDTDTNAAIVGALVGACYGLSAIPKRWVSAVITSRPSRLLGRGSCHRPKWLWSCDALLLAEAVASI